MTKSAAVTLKAAAKRRTIASVIAATASTRLLLLVARLTRLLRPLRTKIHLTVNGKEESACVNAVRKTKMGI